MTWAVPALSLAALAVATDNPVSVPNPSEFSDPALTMRFMQRWEFAEVRMAVIESLVCGRASRSRQAERVRGRLEVVTMCAVTEIEGVEAPLLLIEPWRGPRPCDDFRDAVADAVRVIGELEAMLPSAQSGATR